MIRVTFTDGSVREFDKANNAERQSHYGVLYVRICRYDATELVNHLVAEARAADVKLIEIVENGAPTISQLAELTSEKFRTASEMAAALQPKPAASPQTTGERMAAELLPFDQDSTLRRHVAKAIDNAIADERKACEDIAAFFSGNGYEAACRIADDIRSRKS